MFRAALRTLRAEVVNMELDAIWQTFAETGDPVCYMLYKAAKNRRPEKEDDPGKGAKPRGDSQEPRVTD